MTNVIPGDADVSTPRPNTIRINTPIISAAMDTVTEAPLAIAMARYGGLGVIHRNLSIQDQASEVDKVKRNEAGMITDPVTITADATLAEWDHLCSRYRISGLPVVDEHDVLLGIITNRDTRIRLRALDQPTLTPINMIKTQ